MPVSKIAGNSVVETGSFTMGPEDAEAEYDVADAKFLFRVDAEAAKLSSMTFDDQGRTLMTFRHHQAVQVSVSRTDWESGSRRFSAVFTIQGSAPGPGLRGAHLISYSVTERAV